MGNLTLVQTICIWALPILFAVTIHEAAHGWVANKLGDRTAWLLGRVTMNPIKHIDRVGTILVPLLCLLFGGFVFGWAKPVPVNWYNLRHPRRDGALVAAAGPISNLIMALLWAIVAKIGTFLVYKQGLQAGVLLTYMGFAGISINVMLMVLNFVPIPPLDGSRVVASLLPPRLALIYESITPYGLMILLLLIFTKVLIVVIAPPYEFLLNFIINVIVR